MSKTILIGVAGGTGSGKTTVARNILEVFNRGEAELIEQDLYYKDLKSVPFEKRLENNFDHPNSIDFELLIEHLNALKDGKEVNMPIYDFKKHIRSEDIKKLYPAKIIIVEGILVFAQKELRDLFDMKIFVDTDDDVRLLRRIERDINERGRTFESVKKQYLGTVKPMYLEFVEPTKRYADVIIPRGGENKVAINMIVAKLMRLL
ncbi:uridine kinase [Haliovirga abyssi]|uniref:Uridine kinase n=1 Tax=Haliovirga abyssi TaxID=2996794 RepID=A0AAU9DFJ9_9FUSO|nr:uridine kinase [Haliovirga abyssi]BDU50978.1 uridine kinase [Haliovirga abyssi]